MAGFSVNYDQTFLDSDHDHPLLDFMDGLLGVEMTTGTHPPNLWSEPDSSIWAASDASHDSLYIDSMPVLPTNHQPRSMESFLGSQNKLTIRDENTFVFNSPSFVLEHSQSVIDKSSHCAENLSTSINKTLGSENNHSKVLFGHRIDTTPSGRAKRKNNQHDVNATVVCNSTLKQPWKELEEEKCKRFRSSKYRQVGSESLKLDDNRKCEAELPPKLVKKEPKGESCKDYIHVRARRGQATDSHSLAERVRREKIRERMKRLQELVPGCSKVTGKAQMLDEIINYVQSMQSQVEFLSVKLASVLRICSFNLEIDGTQSEELLPLQPAYQSASNEVEQSEEAARPQMPALSLY